VKTKVKGGSKPLPPIELYRQGFSILCDQLGIANALRFIALFDRGRGDYIRERKKLLKGLTMDELIRMTKLTEKELPR
jgi:hypothetical protein